MSRKYIVLISLICFCQISTVVAQTEQDVGDLDSFGKEARFFGFAQTGVIVVRRDCATLTFPLGPDDRCFALTATNSTSFDVRDIGRIKFPAKTLRNIIYLVGRHQISYTFSNTGTQNRVGRLQYRPYITIVSTVLDDPGLINPQTGQPFNGRMDIAQTGGRTFSKTLFTGYQENDFLTYGSPSISGITKKYLRDNFGLASDVLDDLFSKEMTIQLNVSGLTVNVEEGSVNWGARFLGN